MTVNGIRIKHFWGFCMIGLNVIGIVTDMFLLKKFKQYTFWLNGS